MNNRSTFFIAVLLEVYTAKLDNSLSSIRNVEEIRAQCQLNQFLLGNNCYGKNEFDLDCHYSCQQCIGDQVNNCIQCNILQKRILRDNKCICLQSYYELEQQVICQKCNKSCLTCQGGLESDCLSCDNKSILTINRCICKAGYFIENNNMECSCKQIKLLQQKNVILLVNIVSILYLMVVSNVINQLQDNQKIMNVNVQQVIIHKKEYSNVKNVIIFVRVVIHTINV
ncbi:unnamed protein product [Paramecium pentaurelia]|uniref:Transmembrane protein n=1 Tax=Paramecium pentaurelia TaxID=43138 RepID=A0A8S1SN88_9CILI|nr:unnamed protein product [Paramecium pentaurelia]